MKDHLAGLSERRQQLRLKAAAQREELAVLVDAIEARTRTIDRLFVRGRPLLGKPVLLAGGAAIALFLGPARALRLAAKAAFLIPMARRVFGWLR